MWRIRCSEANYIWQQVQIWFSPSRKPLQVMLKNMTQIGMACEKADHHALVNFLGMTEITKLEDEYLPK